MSERGAEPMRTVVQSYEGPLSPELALVDPVLAARARESLALAPDAHPTLGSAAARASLDATVGRRLVVREDKARGAQKYPKRSDRISWPTVAAMAVVTLVALLLIGVNAGDSGAPSSQVSRVPPVPGTTLAKPKPKPKASKPRASGTTPKASGTRPRIEPSARVKPLRLAWAPVAGASRYHVELFQAGTRVFVGDARDSQVTVPARWKLNGAAHFLRPGEYRWLVWPIVHGRRSGRAIVQSQLVVPAR